MKRLPGYEPFPRLFPGQSAGARKPHAGAPASETMLDI